MTRFKANLLSFATGIRHGVALPEGGTASVLAQDARDITVLSDAGVVTAGSIAFAPTPDVSGCPAHVVPFSGSVSQCGAELQAGDDFYLQVQGYAMAGFLTLVGPTLVRVQDEDDTQAFLADADAALAAGRFPPMLTYPLLHLADPGALGLPTPFDGAGLRLYVDADHVAHIGPNGPAIGTVDELDPEAWRGPAPPQPPPDGAAAALAARPWLARYLVVVQAMQSFVARGLPDVQVSGFGGRLLHPGAPSGTDVADVHAPVLARSGNTYLVYVPDSGRTFRATPDTAAVVEQLVIAPDAADIRQLHPSLLSLLCPAPVAAGA